ncbi:MAG: ClpP family protease [Pirellula sp.]
MPPVFDSHAYQSYQRQRQMTLGDLLLENRIVFLQGEIYTGNANDVVMKLLYLQSENRRKDIHFYINSPGGEVVSTLAIYDTMQMLSCPVATYCIGQAASMGAVLLTAGAKNKRYSLPNSRIMIHQPLAGMQGTAEEISIHVTEFRRTKRRLNEILIKHCGQDLEKIEKDTNRDRFMDPEEAVGYGLIDKVVESMPRVETPAT